MPSKFHIPPCQKRSNMIREAIQKMGGLTKASKALGYKTLERTRQFVTPGLPVPAEKCRLFVRLACGVVSLKDLRPDLYANLTIRELGYTPKGS